VTKPFSPALLRSPAFLLVALIAARATHDRALEQLATDRLADLGIKVTFGPAQTPPAGREEAPRG
jgi:hypothetical protein